MYKRIAIILLILVVGFFFFVSATHAAEQENKVARFFKNIVNWPFNIGKKGAEATGKTAEKAITTVADTATSTVETVTGQPEKAKDIVVEPIMGTAETAATAVEGAIETPVEGTTETFKEEASKE